MHAIGLGCLDPGAKTPRDSRFMRLLRFFVALAVLAVARYSVWYLHEQYLARASSMGLTEADMAREAEEVCRMASMHDALLDVLRPAHDYFERFPARRDALVQAVSTLEAALLLFNVWLFVFVDVWVIVQILVAFFSVLGIQCLWWSPMPCHPAQLGRGAAWLSDLLAGGNAALPLGGVSGSTVFVTIALYNVWRQRKHLDTACIALVSGMCYAMHHLILRWRYSFDELASVLLAAVIIHQIQRARVLSRLTDIHKRLQDSQNTMHISTVSTPTVQRRPPSPLDMAEVLRAYQVEERIESIDDQQFADQLPPRPPLRQIEVYHEG